MNGAIGVIAIVAGAAPAEYLVAVSIADQTVALVAVLSVGTLIVGSAAAGAFLANATHAHATVLAVRVRATAEFVELPASAGGQAANQKRHGNNQKNSPSFHGVLHRTQAQCGPFIIIKYLGLI